ncbi:thymidine phosphorylase [Spiroplasma sp. AdecLV25b]|uniref:thymidine phosphorylase n=1 Tax=Spiroplasma sp. AdecLV25b TaxID=3027162 RepID=UPI0027DF048A|nr:thymidine phosphorylase [Spiroplasma sp. AdecLV25b]
MYMIDLITKKKLGQSLTAEEFKFLVPGIANGTIPDYQISAWAMAVYFQGMSNEEVVAYTKAVIETGEAMDLSQITGFTIDKHSTGGVGDKTSLVFGPIAAALGLKVAKISGRGLGITGGTIDKLEIIPKFKCDLAIKDFIKVVNKVGMSIISQTGNLVPADKKLYALRDVTGTVDSFPLIAASVMSKKIAMGADLILLDIKCGKGAFVADVKNARKLAQLMVHIGKSFNKTVYAIISDMNKPLGKAIGNALELQEVLLSLQNQGPEDLKILVNNLVGLALLGAKKVASLEQGIKQSELMFANEQPLKIFYEFVKAQGGDVNYLKNINNLPPTKHIINITANKSGYLDFINNYALGELSVILGAGRTTKADIIDPMAGIYLKQVHGQKVEKGSVIMELHTNKPETLHDSFKQLASTTFAVYDIQKDIKPIILEIIM